MDELRYEEIKGILLKLSSRMTDLGLRVCKMEDVLFEKAIEDLAKDKPE